MLLQTTISPENKGENGDGTNLAMVRISPLSARQIPTIDRARTRLMVTKIMEDLENMMKEGGASAKLKLKDGRERRTRVRPA
jgi:hypothetical protein